MTDDAPAQFLAAATLSSVLFGVWHVLPPLDMLCVNAAGAPVRPVGRFTRR